jgi:hypothetical protein
MSASARRFQLRRASYSKAAAVSSRRQAAARANGETKANDREQADYGQRF